MLQRKKLTDFFPNLSGKLSREKWTEEEYPKTEKYEIVAYASGFQLFSDNDFRGAKVINFSSTAKVLAFNVKFNMNNQCIIIIDFNNLDCVNEFKQICPEYILQLLKKIERGVLDKDRDQEVDYLPNAQSIVYAIHIYGSGTSEVRDEKRKLLDNILLSIHKIDPFDLRTIRGLNKYFSKFELNSTAYLLEIEKKLNRASGRGYAMGLFTKAELLPAELGAMVGEYINDNETLLNMALTCKQTHRLGIEEEKKEADSIFKKICSRTF